MFDGVPAEQLHQFIAASRTSLPLPLPLPLPPLSFFPPPPPPPPPPLHHHSSSTSSPPLHPFDPYINGTNNNHIHLHPQLRLLQPHDHHLLHHQQQLLNNISPGGGGGVVQALHRQSTAPKIREPAEKEENTISSSGDPWSNDELLALLRIRSTMENWFPEFTWEHVSRKLAEVGFKRSADKCKEKFEEESRYINNISFTKNYRFLTDLEELYQAGGGGGGGGGGGEGGGNDHHQTPSQQLKVEKASANNEGDSREKECRISDEDNGGSKGVEEEESEKEAAVAATAAVVGRAKSGDDDNLKKRKRQRRFDMLKGFCEDIVERMMAQQEEMHTMLLEEMVKRNEEKLAREEAWKKNEIDRMNKELEIMAHEQAIAGDRQATIINFLNKFTSSTSSLSTTTTTTTALLSNPNQNYVDGKEVEVPATSSPAIHQNNPTTPSSVTETTPAPQSPSSSTLNPKTTLPLENPSSGTPAPQNPSSVDNVEEKKHDLGKRWPRDEVLALINLRCSLSNNGGVSSSDNQQDGGGSSSSTTVKAPLWERISQGMLERGYKRSAKRCKEKWENINKYFRKTKDVNKKRSLDSRTCPYFHQLSTLYNEGILMPPSDTQLPENQPLSSPAAPETDHRSNAEEDNVGDSTKHEKNNMEVQVEPVVGAAFEFDF